MGGGKREKEGALEREKTDGGALVWVNFRMSQST